MEPLVGRARELLGRLVRSGRCGNGCVVLGAAAWASWRAEASRVDGFVCRHKRVGGQRDPRDDRPRPAKCAGGSRLVRAGAGTTLCEKRAGLSVVSLSAHRRGGRLFRAPWSRGEAQTPLRTSLFGNRGDSAHDVGSRLGGSASFVGRVRGRGLGMGAGLDCIATRRMEDVRGE